MSYVGGMVDHCNKFGLFLKLSIKTMCLSLSHDQHENTDQEITKHLLLSKISSQLLLPYGYSVECRHEPQVLQALC